MLACCMDGIAVALGRGELFGLVRDGKVVLRAAQLAPNGDELAIGAQLVDIQQGCAQARCSCLRRMQHPHATIGQAAGSPDQRPNTMGSWELDLRSGETLWSDGMYRILGRRRDTAPLTRDEILRYIHPDDRARIAARLSAYGGRVSCGSPSGAAARAPGRDRARISTGAPVVLVRPGRRPPRPGQVTDAGLVKSGASLSIYRSIQLPRLRVAP
jgi:hypothetical protein